MAGSKQFLITEFDCIWMKQSSIRMCRLILSVKTVKHFMKNNYNLILPFCLWFKSETLLENFIASLCKLITLWHYLIQQNKLWFQDENVLFTWRTDWGLSSHRIFRANIRQTRNVIGESGPAGTNVYWSSFLTLS